jgi:hypothetical protein
MSLKEQKMLSRWLPSSCILKRDDGKEHWSFWFILRVKKLGRANKSRKKSILRLKVNFWDVFKGLTLSS